jgi:hypothetical protein
LLFKITRFFSVHIFGIGIASCSTTPTPAPQKEAPVQQAPKLDASAFEKNPRFTPEQVKQKELGCEKGGVVDCADLVRFHGRNSLGAEFAKEKRRLCMLDQVECQLNQRRYPKAKPASKAHSGSLISSWSTHYQDEDGPKSFEYKIYQ